MKTLHESGHWFTVRLHGQIVRWTTGRDHDPKGLDLIAPVAIALEQLEADGKSHEWSDESGGFSNGADARSGPVLSLNDGFARTRRGLRQPPAA